MLDLTMYVPVLAHGAEVLVPLAQADDAGATVPTLDLNWLTVVLGVVLPMLTGLVTNRLAHPGLKAVVLAFLAAVGGLLNELYTVGGNVAAYDWSAGLANALTVFLVAVGLHYGILKPTGITGTNGTVQTGALSGGLGGPAIAAPGSETDTAAHRA